MAASGSSWGHGQDALVYVYDPAADQVSVVTIHDSRSARAATYVPPSSK
jgi:hypothetical protein